MKLSTAVATLRAVTVACVAVVALGVAWRVTAICLSLPEQHCAVSFPLELLSALSGFAILRAIRTGIRDSDVRVPASAVWTFATLLVLGTLMVGFVIAVYWRRIGQIPAVFVNVIVHCVLTAAFFASAAVCMQALADRLPAREGPEVTGLRRMVRVFGIVFCASVLAAALFVAALSTMDPRFVAPGTPGLFALAFSRLLPVFLPAAVLGFAGSWTRSSARSLGRATAALVLLGVAFVADAVAVSGMVAISLFSAAFCLSVALPVLCRRSAPTQAPPEGPADGKPRTLDNPAGVAGLLLVLDGANLVWGSVGGFLGTVSALLLPVVGLALCVAGLFRRPRWPAVVGLSVVVLIILVLAAIILLVAAMFNWN